MGDHAGKVGLALVGLVALWIGVYWLWPAGGGVSFAPIEEPLAVGDGAAGEEGELPVEPPAPRVEEPVSADAGARPVAVQPPEMIRHIVQPGETLRTIAQRYYGTAARAPAIARANPFMDPERLRVGREILVPRDPTNIQGRPVPQPPAPTGETAGSGGGGSGTSGSGTDGGAPQSEPEQTYTVRRGDTLSGISSRVYGTSRHAEAIFRANRSVLRSPDDLKVGQVLRIPRKPE